MNRASAQKSNLRYESRPRRRGRVKRPVLLTRFFAVALALCITVLLGSCVAADASTDNAQEAPQTIADSVPEIVNDVPEPESTATSPSSAATSATGSSDRTTQTNDIEARIAAGDATAKICYLTFDDGPSANTAGILKVLKEKDAVATFFVKGTSDMLSMVKDEEAAGCAVGLHTYSHDYAQIYSSDAAYFQDLAAIQDAVTAQLGHSVNIVRFPGGTSNTVSVSYSSGIMTRLTQSVPAAGYQYFDWNVSGGDSTPQPAEVSYIHNNVMEGASGAQRICVLMHDSSKKSTTVDALPGVIDD